MIYEEDILKSFKKKHLINEDHMSKLILNGCLDNVLKEIIRYTSLVRYNEFYKEMKIIENGS